MCHDDSVFVDDYEMMIRVEWKANLRKYDRGMMLQIFRGVVECH